jgi:hypothetical protein
VLEFMSQDEPEVIDAIASRKDIATTG